MKRRSSALLLIAFAAAAALCAQTGAGRPAPSANEADQEGRRQAGGSYRIEYVKDPEKAKDCPELRTIIVRAVLRANGRVTNIEVEKRSLAGLPDDLAVQMADGCKKAAGGIRFKPAMKDGRPVSQSVAIDYTFCLTRVSDEEEKETGAN